MSSKKLEQGQKVAQELLLAVRGAGDAGLPVKQFNAVAGGLNIGPIKLALVTRPMLAGKVLGLRDGVYRLLPNGEAFLAKLTSASASG